MPRAASSARRTTATLSCSDTLSGEVLITNPGPTALERMSMGAPNSLPRTALLTVSASASSAFSVTSLV